MFSVDAFAASYDEPYIDLVDFHYGGSYTLNLRGTGSLRYFFPGDEYIPCFGFDIILYFNGDISSLSVKNPSLSLVKESLGDNVYRFYGYYNDVSYSLKQVELSYVCSNSTLKSGNILSFKVFTSPPGGFSADTTLSVRLPNGEWMYGYSGEGNTVSFSDVSYEDRLFDFYLDVVDASKYDRLILQFYAYCYSINSIYAQYGSQTVPFSVTYLNSSTQEGFFLVSLDVDLSSIKRSSSEGLTIFVEASANSVSYSGITTITVFESVGYVYSGNNIFGAFLLQIGEFFVDLMGSIDYLAVSILGDEDFYPDTSVSDGLLESGQQIQDFETEHQDVINDNSDAITDVLDLTGFAPALALISDYAGGVFNLLGPYQQVILMPISIGMILFVCSRVPGNMSGRVSRVSSRSIDPKTKEI